MRCLLLLLTLLTTGVSACTLVQEQPATQHNLGEVEIAAAVDLASECRQLGLDEFDAVLQLYHAGNAVIFSDYLEHGASGMFDVPSHEALAAAEFLKPAQKAELEGHAAIGLAASSAAFAHVTYKGMLVVLHNDRFTTGKFVEGRDEHGVIQRQLDLAQLVPGSVAYLDREGRILHFTRPQLEEVAGARARDLDYRVIPQANPLVMFETDKGDVQVELFEDEAPNTVAAFLAMVNSGEWSEGMSFYRVCPYSKENGGENLAIAQAGNPNRVSPHGVALEETPRPHARGSLALLARGGVVDPLHVLFNLDPQVIDSWQGVYPVFGQVGGSQAGFDLDAIREGRFEPSIDDGLSVLDELRPGDAIRRVRVIRQRRMTYEPNWKQE